MLTAWQTLIMVIIGLGVLGVMVLQPLIPRRDPSFETYRKKQQKMAQARVLAAGGWAAIRGGCEHLATNSGDFFVWGDAPLPPPLATLQPQDIKFEVISNAPTVVRIKLFGTGRTGRSDYPYYGLWVVCGYAYEDFVPVPVTGPIHTIHYLTNGIYEVYQ